MSCCAGPIVVDLAQETSLAQDRQRLSELESSAKHLQDGSVLYTLSVPSIHCGQCISTIEKKLSAQDGVVSARANLSMRRVAVTLKNDQQSPGIILKTLDDLGYASQSIDDENQWQGDPEFKTLVRSLAVAGFASANIMLFSVSVWSGAGDATRDLFHFLSALIAIPTVIYAGRPFFRSAFSALKHRRMNMDVPISLGVILATLMSLYESFNSGGHAYFDAAVSLLFFLLIGRTLDYMMRTKARDAVGRLGRLSAKGGLVVSSNGEVDYLPLEGITPGMVLRVAAGERVPVDGTVIDGESDVDRSLITGESIPQRVELGSGLEAGTMNLTGSIDIRAERDAKNSYLAEVMQMMQAAEKGRGLYVRVADRMAKLYSPAVHLLALSTFVFWMIYSNGNWHMSITTAISVLIITCPCALGLAVPVAHVLAASKLFGAGILMKDGSALERLAEIDTIVFDKTGTLTSNVAKVRVCNIPRGKLSSIARTLALRSIHPAARALAASLHDLPVQDLSLLHEVPGSGVEAQSNGQTVRLGRLDWVAELGLPDQVTTPPSGLGFAMTNSPLYVIQLEETLRPGVFETIEHFEDAGIPSEILSGDNEQAVQKVAQAAGVTHYSSGLKPGEKLGYLKSLAAQGRKAMMVGDGLNDAPSLMAAHVSMAPASASDTGRMAADFIFTRDSLSAVWQAHQIAKQAKRIVKENFALAIIYNIVAVPLAMSGALNPFIAALAMSTSSILVVGNSLRLRLTRLEVSKSLEKLSPNRPSTTRGAIA